MATEIGQHALRYTVNVGQRAPMHAFSAGKALLAAMSDKELQGYLAASERPGFTRNTIREPEALRREIASVRASGIARTREEHTPGILGIGRAVIRDGEAIGAFSVAVPAARYSEALEQRIIELLNRSSRILADGMAAARG